MQTSGTTIEPFAYFITIRTYATWLHGDNRGSIDPKHNNYRQSMRAPSPSLHRKMKWCAKETEFLMDDQIRDTVLKSMMTTSDCLKWLPLAIHVRSNHAHIVVQSNRSKEKTMGSLKQYATRDLKKSHQTLLNRQHFWASHGSTKNIWAPEDLFPVLYYVVKGQGLPMSLYYDKEYYDNELEALYECYRDA